MTGTCRGHYESEATRRLEIVAIYRRVHEAGITCSLREKKKSLATGGTVTAMNSSVYQARFDALAAATRAAMKESAIAVEPAQSATGGSEDDSPVGADASDEQAITIARNRASTSVTIAVVGTAAGDPNLVQDTNPGSGRTTHIRTMPADGNGNVAEEVVVVSTDIAAPTATP